MVCAQQWGLDSSEAMGFLTLIYRSDHFSLISLSIALRLHGIHSKWARLGTRAILKISETAKSFTRGVTKFRGRG